MHCPKRPSCFDKTGVRRRVLASSCYPAFFRGHQRVGTPEYLSMMRLRKIWAEGSFSALKREHCISKIRKRGILAATEECLLAAMALNLKRMVNAILFYLQMYYSAGTAAGFGVCFCQQVPYCTLSCSAVCYLRDHKQMLFLFIILPLEDVRISAPAGTSVCCISFFETPLGLRRQLSGTHG